VSDEHQHLAVTSQQFEVIKSMEPFVEQHLEPLLKPVGESWQPSDFLPDLTKDDWREQVSDFRAHARELPDDLLVVLVGDMITEEALPTYQTWLNRPQGVGDPTGSSRLPWARWGRGWTAEEGRIVRREVRRTLPGSGSEGKTEPLKTMFQVFAILRGTLFPPTEGTGRSSSQLLAFLPAGSSHSRVRD